MGRPSPRTGLYTELSLCYTSYYYYSPCPVCTKKHHNYIAVLLVYVYGLNSSRIHTDSVEAEIRKYFVCFVPGNGE